MEYPNIMTGEDIKAHRERLGLNQEEYAELLGLSKNTIWNYENGGKIPKSKIGILEREMAKIATETKEPDAIWVDYNRYMMVPLVSHRAQAGFLSGYGDEEYYEELPKVPFEVDKEYKGRYLCFEVSGDSMDNNTPESLLEGDVLLCREVQKHHWQNRLHINQWDFVLVHKDEGILVKRILEHDTENGFLTLHSLNDYYEDYKIKMKDLIAIFNVVDIKRSRRR